VLVVLDIRAGMPLWRGHRLGVCRLCRSVYLVDLLVGEEIVLDPVCEPVHTDSEQSYAVGGVDLREESRAMRVMTRRSSVGPASVWDRVNVEKS
jgi:hypothetical protein